MEKRQLFYRKAIFPLACLVLALTFADKSDYDKILEDDSIDIICLQEFSVGEPLTLVLNHADGSTDEILATHTYGEKQIQWFKAGSALNMIAAENQ